MSSLPLQSSPPSLEESLLLRDRLLKGEILPLDTLHDFILRAQNSLIRERRKEDKPSDVDFF